MRQGPLETKSVVTEADCTYVCTDNFMSGSTYSGMRCRVDVSNDATVGLSLWPAMLISLAVRTSDLKV